MMFLSENCPVQTATKSKCTVVLERQCPSGPAVRAAVHQADAGVEPEQAMQVVLVRVGMEIGMHLRALGPLGIVRRHGVVGEAIKLLGRLRLHIRVRPRRLPHPAQIVAALEGGHDMAPRGERLGRGSRIRTELPTGRHTLEMRQGERSVAKQVVRIRAGRTTTVEMVAP